MSVMRWVLVLVCACGDSAAGLDASVDGAPPDAPDVPPMLVELPACPVVADSAGVFVRDARQLIVHASDGRPICRHTPGIHVGQIAVPPDGALTIVTDDHDRRLVTVLRPQPDDVISLYGEVEQPFNFDVNIEMPPLTGATRYRLSCPTSTSTSSLPAVLEVSSQCLGADNLVHAFVQALDASNNVVGYAKLSLRPTNVSFGTQGTPVPVSAWLTTLQPLTVTVANMPADLEPATVCYGVIVDGVLNVWTGTCPYAGTAVPMPMSGDALVVQTRLESREEETWVDARRHPIGTASITFDAATHALPRVTTTSLGGTSARPSIGWTTSRPIDRGSVLWATVEWRVESPTTSTSTKWIIAAPIDTPSPILTPQLPLDLQPPGTVGSPELFIWDADGADYTTLRVAPFLPSPWLVFFMPRVTPTTATPSAWGLSARGDYDPY